MGRRESKRPTASARRSATRSTFPTRAGTYFLTRDGRRVGALVVNAAAGRVGARSLFRATSSRRRLRVSARSSRRTPARGRRMAFRAAARRSLIEPALIAALLLLVVEAIVIGARAVEAA